MGERALKARSAHTCFGIDAKDRLDCMLVVASVTLRLEAIRAATRLADVRLIGNLPVLNPGAPVLVVLHEARYQPLPFPIVIRLDLILVNGWEQDLGLEAEAHPRLGPRFQNGVDGKVQSLEVGPSRPRQKLEYSSAKSRIDRGRAPEPPRSGSPTSVDPTAPPGQATSDRSP